MATSRPRYVPVAQKDVHTGALKITDMKMTDHRNVQAWKWRTWSWQTWNWWTWKCRTYVSGVSIGLHGIDFDLAVLPSNRLLLRFQECSRSKSKLRTIRLYCDDHYVFHTWICLSIILQLQEVYTTYFAAVTCILPLFWKDLHTAL